MSRWLVLGVLCAMIAGCGGESQEHIDRETSNMKPLVILYGKFLSRNRGQPPANEEAFKKFIQAAAATTLESFEVANVDELFVSSRDGKPYGIRYRGMPPLPDDIVIYEQDGVDGVRYVADSLGSVTEKTEQEFQPPAGGK